MKNFLACAWCLFMVLAFLFFAFGIWGSWCLWAGLISGFVNMIFTNKNR